ncbi:hypothetical protein [Bacillus velezensis]|uniref:hypothetical protein n=1 Tax=Bacillus velezensis TaxID=492670 RepID=UPI002854C446|nr:hypothetical protein [Bacillus velezensis]MDR7908107.1 hypothetical protein [Bacillus velezensis]
MNEDFSKHLTNFFQDLDKKNKESLKATNLISVATLNLPDEVRGAAMELEKTLGQVAKSSKEDIEKLLQVIHASIVIPRLPKIIINSPKVDLDYEGIEKTIYHNSRNGWTLTEEIPLHFYLDERSLSLKQAELDNKFTSYYEENNFKQLKVLRENLIKGLADRWVELIEHSLELYFEGKFRLMIPVLITIIEGEMSELTESASIGWRLMGDFKGKINDDDKYLAITSYSIVYFFMEKLFTTHSFDEDRLPMINRNWILHGRDNPELWTKADALRLLNALSSIHFIKRYKL